MLRSIAFGGGGTRGVLHAGVYRALREFVPDLTFPDGIYGCSVGCFAALATAYRLPIDQVEMLCYRYLGIHSIVETLTLENVQSMMDRRGLVTMEHYMTSVAIAFDSCGIDLRTKTMDDLPQKVFFVSSNMTTGRASLLTGRIPVLKALACSSCIPFLCCPEILNGHVHLDGAVYSRSLRDVVPPETLIVHLSTGEVTITPSSGTLLDVLTAMLRGVKSNYHASNVLRIENQTVGFLEDLSEAQKKAAMDEAYSQACAFFAKRLPQELK